jgi:hypothetical protein
MEQHGFDKSLAKDKERYIKEVGAEEVGGSK